MTGDWVTHRVTTTTIGMFEILKEENGSNQAGEISFFLPDCVRCLTAMRLRSFAVHTGSSASPQRVPCSRELSLQLSR